MKINQFEINNQASDDSAELIIYGIVGSYWDDNDAKDIVSAIRRITAKKIIVRIYSEGGSVFAGLAIYNALVEHPADIIIRIDSLAASIASVIAMSGKVEMPENAFMVIHNPWGGVVGEASDMEKMAAVLKDIKNSLITVYLAKTGLDAEKLSSMMDDETWMMAKAAVELGFADEVIGAESGAKNMIAFNHLKNFRNVPDEIREIFNGPASPEKPATKEKTTMDLEKLKAEHPDLYKQIYDLGFKAGEAKGASAETERIKSVQNQSMPGHEPLVAEMMFDGKTTGPEAAVKILAAEKQIRVNAKAAIDSDRETPVPPAASTDFEKKTGTIDDNLPIDEKAKAEWDGDASIRNEFGGDFDVYLAYRKNEGNVKSIG